MIPPGDIKHLRSWLIVIERHYESYHNHKETSAWFSFAAYLVFIFGLVTRGLHVTDNRVLLAVFTALVVAAAMGLLLFFRRQLELRRMGGLMTVTADVLLTKLLANSYANNLQDAKIYNQERIPEDHGYNFWPLLRGWIRYKRPDGKWPELFIEEFKNTAENKEGDENRRFLELIPQLLMIFGTIVYAVALWLCYFGVQ